MDIGGTRRSLAVFGGAKWSFADLDVERRSLAELSVLRGAHWSSLEFDCARQSSAELGEARRN